MAGMGLAVTSQVLKAKTSASPAVVSFIQVTGVVLSLAGILWGLAALAALLGRCGDRISAAILWASVAGLVLLPFLGIGAAVLLPALLTLIVLGRLGSAPVRLPALVVLVGLLSAGLAAGWKSGVEGPAYLNVLVFAAAALEGAGWIWFGRATEGLSAPT